MISASSVADILRQNGIASVAIIDDAFDAPELCMVGSAAQSLFDDLASEPNLLDAFSEAGTPVEAADDLTPAALLAIKARRAEDPSAVVIWRMVEVAASARRTALDAFATDLRKDLKLSVTKIAAATIKDEGTRGAKKQLVKDEVDVVFLDYELRDGEEEGTLSSAILDRIYRQFFGKAKTPLVILMSSLKLDELKVSDFQKKTKVLSGMFYFVPKEELFDPEKRHYRLAAFAQALSTGRTLQKFVAGIERSLSQAQDRVFADVRSLSIGDFAFLQKLRLHEDGQPLGEYLLWLMNAHLIKELLGSTDVQTVEAEVNAMPFDDLPPTQSKPSINLATLYSSAVLRPMQDLPAEPTDQATYLQFGDLFRKGTGKQVWLCITPPCDLAFGPTRPIRSKQSVLFLPGTLQPIDQRMKAFEQRQPRTELVWLDKKAFRIIWNTKEVARTGMKELGGWVKAQGVSRIARLNTAFALEIQRSFASDLTRIGMPTPPPFYNPVKVRLAVQDLNGAEVELTASTCCDGYLTGDENNQRLVLGEGFMDRLPDMLSKADEVLQLRVDDLRAKRTAKKANPGMVKDAETAQERISHARSDATILSGLKGPFEVPAAAKATALLDELVSIAGDGNMSPVADHVPLRLTILPFEDAADEPLAA